MILDAQEDLAVVAEARDGAVAVAAWPPACAQVIALGPRARRGL
jgi:hypothetical protein